MKAGVVEAQLLQRIPEVLVLVRIGGIHAGKYHRFDVPISRQQLGGTIRGIENGVSHAGITDVTKTRDQIADFPRGELTRRMLAKLQISDLVNMVDVVR